MRDDTHSPRRREFLSWLATAGTTVGVGAAVWPLVASMQPAAGVRAARFRELRVASIGYDRIVVTLPGRAIPVTVFRLTARQQDLLEIDGPCGVPCADRHDGPRVRRSAATGLFEGAVPWHKPVRRDIIVFIAICTWDAILLGQRPGTAWNEADGYRCPWCASIYDFAGRVQSGPARSDFWMPQYSYPDKATLAIGGV